MGAAIALFKGFVYLIGFGSILFLTYITTKYIGSRANKVTKGKYISTVDTVTIGLNKQLHLVKVGEKFVLIASSGKNIEFLTDVNLDNFEFEKKPESNGIVDFKSLVEKYFQTFKSKKNEKSDDKDSYIDNQSDSPSIPLRVNFKNNLNKLRAITSKIDKSVKEYGDERADEK